MRASETIKMQFNPDCNTVSDLKDIQRAMSSLRSRRVRLSQEIENGNMTWEEAADRFMQAFDMLAGRIVNEDEE